MDVEQEAWGLLRGLGSVPSMRDVFAARVGGELRTIDSLPAGDAAALWTGTQWLVYVRRDLGPVALRWAIAHEIAEVHLDRLGIGGDVEALANRLAAALTMPRDRFASASLNSIDLPALAHRFMVSESAATLRLAEVSVVEGAAVSCPRVWHARGVVKVATAERRRITDAPRRVALLCA
jgi:hypothetical protein